MKEGKEKAYTEKVKKVKDAVEAGLNSSDKNLINPDIIRGKANEIYLQRIERGEYGSAEDDWIEAEKFYSESEG